MQSYLLSSAAKKAVPARNETVPLGFQVLPSTLCSIYHPIIQFSSFKHIKECVRLEFKVKKRHKNSEIGERRLAYFHIRLLPITVVFWKCKAQGSES